MCALRNGGVRMGWGGLLSHPRYNRDLRKHRSQYKKITHVRPAQMKRIAKDLKKRLAEIIKQDHEWYENNKEKLKQLQNEAKDKKKVDGS